MNEFLLFIKKHIINFFPASYKMKIDFDKLNDSDKIAFRASKTESKSLIVNSIIAFCTVGALIISIYTIISTKKELKESYDNMISIVNSAKITAEAAKKSTTIAENALKQSINQFLNLNRSGLSYQDASIDTGGINVNLLIQGKKEIKLNSINYFIQFLPRDSVKNFKYNLRLNAFYNYTISPDKFNKLEGHEESALAFPFISNPPTDSLYWNNALLSIYSKNLYIYI